VKVQNFQNTENQSWGPGGRRALGWVQGNALARGPGGRRPPEAPGIKHFINTFQSLS